MSLEAWPRAKTPSPARDVSLKGKRHSLIHALNVLSENSKTGGDRVEGEAEPVETPGAFLDALGDDLKGKEGVDADLANILKTYILKVAPAQNAVAQAKDAILKLAIERANPPKPEAGDG